MKKALSDSLKESLTKKSLNKITINEIVKKCGVNRQTFYYHFKDIYDLLEWTLNVNIKNYEEELTVSDLDPIEYAYTSLLRNKKIILNAYSSADSRWINNYLIRVFEDLIIKIFEDNGIHEKLSKENEDFLIRFYSNGLAGIVIVWIENGMSDEYSDDLLKINQLIDLRLKNIKNGSGYFS